MIKRDWPILFRKFDLRRSLEGLIQSISETVREIPEAEFETRTDDFLAATVASKKVVSPIRLMEDRIEVSRADVQVDVSHDPNRHFFEPGPHYVDGLELTFHVPFEGEKELFFAAPDRTTSVYPRAFVDTGELRFPYDSANRAVEPVKKQFEKDLQDLKTWLTWVNAQVEDHNARLEPAVHRAVVARRAEIAKTKADVADLGFPVRGEEAGGQEAPDPEQLPARRAERRAREGRQYDVALSFAGEDREYVEAVASKLDELEVKVFYDRFEEVELWGKDLAEHLGKVYSEDSHFVVMFASRYYAEKAWPNHERRFALSRNFTGDADRILPVRMDDTAIPGLPDTIAYLDARVVSAEKLGELIRQKLDLEI